MKDKLADTLTFAQLHAPVWNARAAQLGLSTAQTSAWLQETSDAAAAMRAVAEAKQALASAVMRQATAFDRLKTRSGALTAIVRGHARQQANPTATYIAAEIPSPRAASPIGPPRPATSLVATLRGSDPGVKITWKASQNAPGVIYRLERSIQTADAATVTPWTLITLTGEKFAIDDAIPASGPGDTATPTYLYRVVAQRGDLRSEASALLVVALTGASDAIASPSTGGVRLAA